MEGDALVKQDVGRLEDGVGEKPKIEVRLADIFLRRVVLVNCNLAL